MVLGLDGLRTNKSLPGAAGVQCFTNFIAISPTISECARIWKGGCIIRAGFLNTIKAAYVRNPDLANLLVRLSLCMIS